MPNLELADILKIVMKREMLAKAMENNTDREIIAILVNNNNIKNNINNSIHINKKVK